MRKIANAIITLIILLSTIPPAYPAPLVPSIPIYRLQTNLFPEWEYVALVDIYNPTGQAITNGVVAIELKEGQFPFHRARRDLADLRFATLDGQVLDYYIVNMIPDKYALIFVKIPQANPGDNYIYMFYGNPAATPTSDPSEFTITAWTFTNTRALRGWTTSGRVYINTDNGLKLDPFWGIYGYPYPIPIIKYALIYRSIANPKTFIVKYAYSKVVPTNEGGALLQVKTTTYAIDMDNSSVYLGTKAGGLKFSYTLVVSSIPATQPSYTTYIITYDINNKRITFNYAGATFTTSIKRPVIGAIGIKGDMYVKSIEILTTPNLEVKFIDYGWAYAVRADVYNEMSVDITSAKVLVRVDYDVAPRELFAPNGADIRVVDETGQLLPHKVIEWSDSYALIGVEVPVLKAKSVKTLYIFFGNPVAVDASTQDTFPSTNPRGIAVRVMPAVIYSPTRIFIIANGNTALDTTQLAENLSTYGRVQTLTTTEDVSNLYRMIMHGAFLSRDIIVVNALNTYPEIDITTVNSTDSIQDLFTRPGLFIGFDGSCSYLLPRKISLKRTLTYTPTISGLGTFSSTYGIYADVEFSTGSKLYIIYHKGDQFYIGSVLLRQGNGYALVTVMDKSSTQYLALINRAIKDYQKLALHKQDTDKITVIILDIQGLPKKGGGAIEEIADRLSSLDSVQILRAKTYEDLDKYFAQAKASGNTILLLNKHGNILPVPKDYATENGAWKLIEDGVFILSDGAITNVTYETSTHPAGLPIKSTRTPTYQGKANEPIHPSTINPYAIDLRNSVEIMLKYRPSNYYSLYDTGTGYYYALAIGTGEAFAIMNGIAYEDDELLSTIPLQIMLERTLIGKPLGNAVTIILKVVNAKGRPLEGVTVTVGGRTYTVNTQTQAKAPYGQVQITATKSGYDPATTTITATQDTVTVEITLTPAKIPVVLVVIPLVPINSYTLIWDDTTTVTRGYFVSTWAYYEDTIEFTITHPRIRPATSTVTFSDTYTSYIVAYLYPKIYIVGVVIVDYDDKTPLISFYALQFGTRPLTFTFTASGYFPETFTISVTRDTTTTLTVTKSIVTTTTTTTLTTYITPTIATKTVTATITTTWTLTITSTALVTTIVTNATTITVSTPAEKVTTKTVVVTYTKTVEIPTTVVMQALATSRSRTTITETVTVTTTITTTPTTTVTVPSYTTTFTTITDVKISTTTKHLGSTIYVPQYILSTRTYTLYTTTTVTKTVTTTITVTGDTYTLQPTETVTIQGETYKVPGQVATTLTAMATLMGYFITATLLAIAVVRIAQAVHSPKESMSRTIGMLLLAVITLIIMTILLTHIT
ncbi:DUF2341 domain-containing protein [Pyrococcus kukulkanii]|uniref:DUF2341 domain-containing protein n=1 Tax=Pyrococcus kukulkanii TaxID=1609559 RepID=A0ABV4T652_9EURY